MNVPPLRLCASASLAVSTFFVAAPGCGKREEVKRVTVSDTAWAEIPANRAGSLPGPVYQSQADSPIRWQPWEQESFDLAERTQRLLLVVVVMPQQPSFQSFIAMLEEDRKIVEEINSHYVPVLLDADAAREMGLLTAEFCAETKHPLSLPLFLWVTHQKAPVSWLPMLTLEPQQVREVFRQSHATVARMWDENRGYVLNNSAENNVLRAEGIDKRWQAIPKSERPEADLLQSIRQLTSLYDPVSRTFDDAGGLFPAGAIDLLASAAINPGIPADLRNRALATTSELLEDLLPSGMFDPLEGGVFSARQSISWSLPAFYRNCPMQGRAAVALIRAYQATGNEEALERALNAIAFAENSFTTSDGLFAFGMQALSAPETWLWSVDAVEQALPEEDAKWWMAATGMKSLGNLPSEVDQQRIYFRLNSLALARPLAQVAADLSVPEAEFSARFETSRKRLLEIRENRMRNAFKDTTPHAGATLRMVSAYAMAFSATGDEAYRTKAVNLLGKAREQFSQGPRFNAYVGNAAQSVAGGRAFLYGLAIQAANDVADITSDDAWLLWADDLASTAEELFMMENIIKECPDPAVILNLPVSDVPMLFDDSSTGLFSLAECLAKVRGRPLPPDFAAIASPLPEMAATNPMLYTMQTQGAMIRYCSPVLVTGSDLSPEMKLAVERLPLRVVPRRAAGSSDDLPPGAAKIVFSDGEERVLTSPEAIREAALPSAINP